MKGALFEQGAKECGERIEEGAHRRGKLEVLEKGIKGNLMFRCGTYQRKEPHRVGGFKRG